MAPLFSLRRRGSILADLIRYDTQMDRARKRGKSSGSTECRRPADMSLNCHVMDTLPPAGMRGTLPAFEYPASWRILVKPR